MFLVRGNGRPQRVSKASVHRAAWAPWEALRGAGSREVAPPANGRVSDRRVHGKHKGDLPWSFPMPHRVTLHLSPQLLRRAEGRGGNRREDRGGLWKAGASGVRTAISEATPPSPMALAAGPEVSGWTGSERVALPQACRMRRGWVAPTSETLVILLDAGAKGVRFLQVSQPSHRGFALQTLSCMSPCVSKPAVLKVWPGDPWGSPRNFQRIHYRETIFLMILRCYLSFSPYGGVFQRPCYA